MRKDVLLCLALTLCLSSASVAILAGASNLLDPIPESPEAVQASVLGLQLVAMTTVYSLRSVMTRFEFLVLMVIDAVVLALIVTATPFWSFWPPNTELPDLFLGCTIMSAMLSVSAACSASRRIQG